MAEADTRKRVVMAIGLDRLCAEQSYDQIEVRDICEATGFSKSTFYRVFDSKYSICTWYQDLLLEASVGQAGRTLSWAGAFSVYHSGWLLFPNMSHAAKEHRGADSVEARWPRRFSELVLDTIRNYKRLPVDDDLLFHVHYLALTTRPQPVTPSLPWFDELYARSPEEYGRLMSEYVPHDLHRLLNEPDRPTPSKRPVVTLADLFEIGDRE